MENKKTQKPRITKPNNMAKINLAELETRADEQEDLATVAPSMAIGAPRPSVTGIEADVNASDIRIPRINLVQKSSELADVEGWSPGDIAFAKEVKIIPFGATGIVSFLHLRRQYQENLPYGSGETPKVFNTREEVFANGGSLSYQADNEYRPIAHLTMLVELPEGASDADEAYFPLAFNGKSYGMAVWTVASSAYNSVAKELITAAAVFLKTGIHKVAWELSVQKKKAGTNTYMVPVIKQHGKHSPEMIEFIESLMA